jgi:hypothetical protein
MMGKGDKANANVAEPSALGTSDYGAAETKRLAADGGGGFDWEQLFSGLSKIKPSDPGSTAPTFTTPSADVGTPAAGALPQGGRLSFLLSPRQESMLGQRFGADTASKRKYVIERILSGDRSLAPYTPEQMLAARTQSVQAAPAQQPSAFAALVRSVGAP